MADAERAIQDLQDGWTFVMQQGAILALFPIEEWLTALDRGETLGPILDPTLRKYLYSSKPRIIKSVLEAALTFKLAILKAQREVLSDPKLRLEVLAGKLDGE